MERTGRRRRARRLGVAGLAILGLGLLPPVQARLKAAAVLLDAIGLPFPRPFASAVERTPTLLEGVEGDLYHPGRPSPPLLLLPGATPRGRADTRVIRVAEAAAAAGRLIFVPELDLYDRRFTEEDLERIVTSALGLGSHPDARGTVSLLGFSYGGSFGMVAAADPRLEGRLEQVAVFGAYYDLVGVIQGVTTGVSRVGDRTLPWEAHPDASEVLRAYAVEVAPGEQREKLREALAGSADPDGLPPEGRAVYDLIDNSDPARTFPLAERLDPEARALLDRFSPASVSSQITAPVVAMHSRDDPAVPYGEALRLVRGIPGSRLASVRMFRHVDFRVTSPRDWAGAAVDLWQGWRFASWVLAPQERLGRG